MNESLMSKTQKREKDNCDVAGFLSGFDMIPYNLFTNKAGKCGLD